MQEFSTLPYLEFGGIFLIGLALGYLLKKTFKVALLLLGVIVLILFGAEYFGIVGINEIKLENMADSGIEAAKTTVEFLKERLFYFTAKGVTAVAGFLVGLKVG